MCVHIYICIKTQCFVKLTFKKHLNILKYRNGVGLGNARAPVRNSQKSAPSYGTAAYITASVSGIGSNVSRAMSSNASQAGHSRQPTLLQALVVLVGVRVPRSLFTQTLEKRPENTISFTVANLEENLLTPSLSPVRLFFLCQCSVQRTVANFYLRKKRSPSPPLSPRTTVTCLACARLLLT
jgi:hypothetical protein